MSSDLQNEPKKAARIADNGVTIGNASNPSLDEETTEAQLLGKEAEKYLREGGNIEDMPDEKDQQNMDDAIDNNKNS